MGELDDSLLRLDEFLRQHRMWVASLEGNLRLIEDEMIRLKVGLRCDGFKPKFAVFMSSQAALEGEE